MAEIFISYKSERRKAAAHLAKILQRYGYSVWYDYSLVKGRDFAKQIDAEIRAAKAVVVLWCSLSVASDWVADEAALAAKLGTLLPAKIEPCELRVDFDRKDHVDLTGWNGAPLDYKLYPLIDAVSHRVGRAPQLDFKAMREFEEDWQRYGSQSLRAFAFEAPVEVSYDPSFLVPSISSPRYDPTLAERDWDRFKIGETESITIIRAFIDQHGKTEPLWATLAQQRLAAVESAIMTRVAKDRLAHESLESGQLAARFGSEGRMEITAPFVTNPNGLRFLPGAGKTEWFKDIENGPEMVVVPQGKFMMGSPKDEPQRGNNEEPQHEVGIPNPFAIGRCPVTRGQFATFVAATGHHAGLGTDLWREPNFPQDDNHPVVRVNWHDARAYAAWLAKVSSAPYRLPSEAEWEYACRAGSETPFWWGSSISPDQANYDGSAEPYKGGGKNGDYRKQTVPVKHFRANPWGLYQVHGEVWEWCEDVWHDGYSDKPEGLRTTGGAWTTGDYHWRVLRGGSWNSAPQNLRSACRSDDLPDYRYNYIGFRVARTLDP